MACIVCFSDHAAVASVVQQGLSDRDHLLHVLSASRLTSELRRAVQHLAPDLILLELSHAVDNPHLYFFLRSDQTTRHVPIILISTGARLAQLAEALGADGYLQRPFAAEQFRHVLDSCLLQYAEVAA